MSSRPSRRPVARGPLLRALPPSRRQGAPLLLEGRGFPAGLTTFRLGARTLPVDRALLGRESGAGVVPRGGAFFVRLQTFGIAAGRHTLRASSASGPGATVEIDVIARHPARAAARGGEGEAVLEYGRGGWFFDVRFGHLGRVPAGLMRARTRAFARLRKSQRYKRHTPAPRKPPIVFALPLHGDSNWTPLGPAPIAHSGSATSGPVRAFAGRVRCIAIDPKHPARMYIGAASGGVWKSEDHGVTWMPRTDDAPSLAIGALAIDRTATNRLLAGTGEYSTSTGQYYGYGLLSSKDFGETWSSVGADTFDRSTISRIVFDPIEPQTRAYVASDIGVFETKNGGSTWQALRPGSAGDLVARVGAGDAVELVAGFAAEGLYRARRTGSKWSEWLPVASAAFPATFDRIALGQCLAKPQHLWAVFAGAKGVGYAGIARSDDGGETWTAVESPESGGSTGYTLHVTVHPKDPETVFLGELDLWRKSAGEPFTKVSSLVLHVDHHAAAFDELDPAVAYVCCDGGVMVTKDGGDTWEHRNRGLSTAQVARFAQHPQYASVILCGMQDLGGAFGNGAPVWKVRHWDDGPFESMQGDGVLAAIPPHEPHRRFYGYQDHALRRSDDGGRNFKIKQSVAGYWFYPLAFDPGTAGVCYFGSNTLQRSEDYLDNFQFATAALGSAFSTIAVHPGDPNQVVVGTVEGAVWRVQRTGPSWFVADVTATDLAAPPLPPGRCVSCVAIEAGGAIWVSFSSIFLTEDEKEFDSGAVFRLAADASTWEDRSQGLPEADPVNALAIDPASGAVFCGADRGVFRWDSASEAWLLWDHGLPNAPVFDLAVHAASKTLRAATYGRGVWERPIALPSVPDVDVYIRGNVAHGGKGPPPSGEPDPFYPDDLVWWWQSADVKVDSHQLETEALTDDPVAFAAKISYENVRRGKLNRFYVQTHNRGPFTATKVRVRAFLADASLGLPNLPADFWAAGGPFDKAPSGTDWTAVGPTYEVGDLQPGTSGVAGWEVVVAQSTAEHTCLLALVTCDEDPLDAGGVLVIEQLVNGHNNAALRNLVVTSD